MLAEYTGFFSRDALADFGFRWLHIVVGIVWIGLLYFFNFVQVPAYALFEAEPHKEIGGKARLIALDKVTRRALWWFRWAALATFLTGIVIVGLSKDYFKGPGDVSGMKLPGNVGILTGMLIGTIMFVNVWGIIWRNQKIVLANAANVLAGGQPDPAAAAAGRKALMASRQNTIFSISLLYFMVYRAHAAPFYAAELSAGKLAAFWIITLVLLVVLELNALGMMPWKTEANKGLNVIYDGPGARNFLVAGFGLWAIFLLITEVLFKA